MEPNKRPQGREKKVTGHSTGVHKTGDGLGTGKVGSKEYSGQGSGGSVPKRAAVGGGGIAVIAILALLLFKGGGLFGGGGSSSGGAGGLLSSGNTSGNGYTASGETSVNTAVEEGSRAKRTVIKGNNQDTVTMMVYMCGTDLESKYGMASSDLEEMCQASKNLGDKMNIIVYTGGCSKWKGFGISNSSNQYYQIKNGKLNKLKEESGKPMTDPDTLSSFIKYCTSNYPANRNELIFWDHGGGSVSGYGYDEKYEKKGSMSLAGIRKALNDGGTKFDFIGFDACLMATAENALMLNEYADYLIASEETEPGIGWYYTNWVEHFANNTSMPTVDIGKEIVDDFVSQCAQKCRGQQTTLSVIDLAEFSYTIPEKLSAFSKSVSDKISKEEYKELSDARYSTREFAESSKIDQVDLADLAINIGTDEGKALAEALKKAVKYNRTSTNMTDAHGVSIYFPYKRTSYVDPACSTYDQIGMDSDYAKCIKQFAKLETSGQIAAGGSSSPLNSLFGLGGSGGSSGGSADMIASLLGAFMKGGSSDRSIDGLDDSNTSFMSDGDNSEAAEYIADHYFDPTNLVWEENDGKYTMELSDSQWELVHSVDMNMFYDDGEGYIDLGLDNLFTTDGDTLIADTDRNWVAINGQPVAYYHTDTFKDEDGKNTDLGYVPAMLQGDRVNLIIVLKEGEGYIAGATTDYVNGETDTVAKSSTELTPGDELRFICDYYSYDMEYQDSYFLGEPMTVTSDMKVTNEDVGTGEVRITYLFTDIYNQEYWSEVIKK